MSSPSSNGKLHRSSSGSAGTRKKRTTSSSTSSTIAGRRALTVFSKNNKRQKYSREMLLRLLMVMLGVVIVVYVAMVIAFARYHHQSTSSVSTSSSNPHRIDGKRQPSVVSPWASSRESFRSARQAVGRRPVQEELLVKKEDTILERDRTKRLAGARSKADEDQPHEKQQLRNNNKNKPEGMNDVTSNSMNSETMLRAYREPIDKSQWSIKPLPTRTSTAADLKVTEYPQLTSCSKLMEQWPVDDYPDDDPFLPWIHDVFPTHEGDYLQFVAQNKRRCHTGKTDKEEAILNHTQPQIALFQHVPVRRVRKTLDPTTTRYILTSHENADPDGMETRFICRFKPSDVETLSEHNVNYDFAAWRKGHRHTFSPEGHLDLKSIHTSQLIFRCPIPPELREAVRSGASVQNDWATLFVDLIPIRTPPRYGPPDQFFPPQYKESESKTNPFRPEVEWGTKHLLPKVEDSGRWENIPICKPSLQTYESHVLTNGEAEQKTHRLVACLWASSGYTTRGERFTISDGSRRLREWILFNRMTGVEHFYIYDNSAAHGSPSLASVTDDLFPKELVTRVVWPSKVCNNRPNNVDSPGERSSQYAAESSCRLRFGPHTDWIAQFDIDEYLAPMGEYNSLLPLLDKLDSEGKKILSFGSWRSWPRRDLIEPPKTIRGRHECGYGGGPCFEVKVPPERTILQTYNCDRQKGPKKDVMPAEKQLYRADYVKQHFIHYSTITELSMMNTSQWKEAAPDLPWRRHIGADPLSRFGDEIHEATMLHTKAIATKDTNNWERACSSVTPGLMCRIGNPFPNYGKDWEAANALTAVTADKKDKGKQDGKSVPEVPKDDRGWLYNCFVNEKIETYYVPKLEEALKEVTSKESSTSNKRNSWF